MCDSGQMGGYLMAGMSLIYDLLKSDSFNLPKPTHYKRVEENYLVTRSKEKYEYAPDIAAVTTKSDKIKSKTNVIAKTDAEEVKHSKTTFQASKAKPQMKHRKKIPRAPVIKGNGNSTETLASATRKAWLHIGCAGVDATVNNGRTIY
ncbi:hypothetical protein HHI36_017392 [Cryptolaemus montrouzieri]|uniref:Uncharacterized protein n=1 Tax=Cryptolaemus montrouzieri TaxID=559131 RepID=A0ABD2NMD6_9CUCU